MTVLVSEATGFVGSVITRHLLENGPRVHAMARPIARPRGLCLPGRSAHGGRPATARRTFPGVSSNSIGRDAQILK